MTTKISESANERILDKVVREQFDAFERKERQIRTEERMERATKLRLPVGGSTRLARPNASR
jgi:hypothetical protein